MPTTDTICHRVLSQAKLRPNAPAYLTKEGGAWVAKTWREYAYDVRRAAKALLALGFRPKDTTCILGFNRYEWVVLDVATMMAGGAPAGIYTTCSKDEVRYIVAHAEAPVVLVENQAQWEKIRAERASLPKLRQVVMMKGGPKVDDPMVLSWESFLAKGDLVADRDLDERLAALEPQGLATLIYTSGTTGPPKGVMLSHENLAWTAAVAKQLVATGPWDRCLSYLPLAHIAEQMFTIHGPATTGYSVHFAQSIEKLGDDVKEVEPTLFFGVPRVWEKFHAGIAGKLAEAKGAKKKLVDWARGVGMAHSLAYCEGRSLDPATEVQYKLAKKLVFDKLKKAIGMGRMRIGVSGAAPIAKEVLEFFATLDIPIMEVYGQSEDTGPTSFNQPGRAKFGTVGPPIPGVEVKIESDGEILVKGKNVFLGYYKDPDATREALKDGYLCSGDLGEFDRDGFLNITGRKKEIIITAGGKNITPKNIESAIKNHPLVGEVVVIGDRRKYLTALVALDLEAVAKFLKERGETHPPHLHPGVREEIQKVVDEVNQTLARVETIKKFAILARPFSMEHGELTPTLKVKRKKVHENFAEEIEAMYREVS